jgi:hypothetical protein
MNVDILALERRVEMLTFNLSTYNLNFKRIDFGHFNLFSWGVLF